ncbi:hypothetical protein Avbf_00012 [Armadillidium vulgare]|nr:hypothetical protein Avbf_00012 [Armadillidium vulgare]
MKMLDMDHKFDQFVSNDFDLKIIEVIIQISNKICGLKSSKSSQTCSEAPQEFPRSFSILRFCKGMHSSEVKSD